MRPAINFPVLRSLVIDGYQLYPGYRTNLGIYHNFPAGVALVVGLNGLGKTTLLNMLQRCLLGPWNPTKGELARPGSSQASLTRVKRFTFFRSRVEDQARDAFVEACFDVGKHSIVIRRSLYDLRLLSFRVGDDTDAAPDEETVMSKLAALVGVGAPFDFDFIVRHLIFFLEEKVPLVWNPEGQFAILRILLLDKEPAQELTKTRNELLKVDSYYRNLRWFVRSAEEELRQTLERLKVSGRLVKEREILQTQLQAAEEALDDAREEAAELYHRLKQAEARNVQARAARAGAQSLLAERESDFFRSIFNSSRPPGDIIYEALVSDQGCLVCGTTSPAAAVRTRRLIEECKCPVCESSVSQRPDIASLRDKRRQNLKEAEEQFALADRNATGAQDTYEEALADYERFSMRRDELLEAKNSLALQLRTLDKDLPDEEVLETELKAQELRQLDLDRTRARLDGARMAYARRLEEARTEIEAFAQNVVDRFNEYAKEFLAERCFLQYALRTEQVGQESGALPTPGFEVWLSSGPGTEPTLRENPGDVSESQKEFIDLAFRMALLRVASGKNPSMLVIETPEASLDVVFVAQAGALLRRYAAEHPGNLLLVSTNLNREGMIGAILGLAEMSAASMRREDKERRILNLLKVARPNQALEDHRPEYEQEYEQAIGEAPRG